MDMRDEFTGTALVYKERIFPLAGVVIDGINAVFQNYEVLSFEEWKEDLSGIIADVHKFAQQAEFIKNVHKVILVDLKKTQDKGDKVLSTLKLEADNYGLQATKLKQYSDKKRGWAAGMAFIPLIGPLYFAPMLTLLANNDLARATAAQTEADIAVATADTITSVLVVALNEFIAGVEYFSGFFRLLESTLNRMEAQTDIDIEGLREAQLKRHYRLVRDSAKEIRKSTVAYISMIPTIESNLEAIPASQDLQNYVQTWLQSKLVAPEKSYLQYAMETFTQKKILKLLASQ